MKNFDFLVIGAMKSGTTTIHDLLKMDSRIALPVGKEAPFFTEADRLAKGFNAFVKDYYPSDVQGKCIGKVSPQYMAWFDVAASNITKYSPDTKLIAVLRDPIERLLSHYSMCVAMGLEKRPLNEAISQCLKYGNPKPKGISRVNSYILWSEYGRILTTYERNDPLLLKKLLIIGFDNLVQQQSVALEKIYKHIGLPLVAKGFVNKKSLSRGEGGNGFAYFLNKYPVFSKVLVRLLPRRWAGVIRMKKIEAQIAMNSIAVSRSDIDEALLSKLIELFHEDSMKIKRMGYKPYWS